MSCVYGERKRKAVLDVGSTDPLAGVAPNIAASSGEGGRVDPIPCPARRRAW
jgi:hypothetical protein